MAMTIKVLIADDHAIIRDGLRALLEAASDILVVGDASDGLTAINLARELQPDVVIMDISMPGLNGIEAASRILAGLPKTRVIILSMSGTAEHVFRALQAGARGYLLKESAGREVVDAVLTVYSGKIYLSEPVQSVLIADYIELRGKNVDSGPLERLSAREREVLILVVEGKTSAEIGAMLYLSPKTVETYRSRMMHKLGVPDLPSLFKLASQEGLLSSEKAP
jgi:DNA-binding NarL/FixJ family response regulator